MIRSVSVTLSLLLVFGAARAASDAISPKSKTPLAIYQKIVTDRIGQRWYAYTKSKLDMLEVGTVTVNFRIEKTGQITNLKVVSNSSNAVFAQLCVSAILEAKIPPIPQTLRKQTGQDFIEWDNVNFTLYPDQDNTKRQNARGR